MISTVATFAATGRLVLHCAVRGAALPNERQDTLEEFVEGGRAEVGREDLRRATKKDFPLPPFTNEEKCRVIGGTAHALVLACAH